MRHQQLLRDVHPAAAIERLFVDLFLEAHKSLLHNLPPR